MDLEVLPSSKSPSIAERVREALERLILDEGLQPGDRIGSERHLAETLQANRSTIRPVLAALEEAGRIYRLPGRSGGIFISYPRIERDLGRLRGLPEYLSQQGQEGQTRILATRSEPASATVASALDIEEGESVYLIQRVWVVSGQAISAEWGWLPAALFDGLLSEPLGGNIYQLLEDRYSVQIGGATEHIDLVLANQEIAQILDVEVATPLLRITRTTKDTHGKLFEFSHDYFRGDRVRITVHAEGKSLIASAIPVTQ